MAKTHWSFSKQAVAKAFATNSHQFTPRERLLLFAQLSVLCKINMQYWQPRQYFLIVHEPSVGRVMDRIVARWSRTLNSHALRVITHALYANVTLTRIEPHFSRIVAKSPTNTLTWKVEAHSSSISNGRWYRERLPSAAMRERLISSSNCHFIVTSYKNGWYRGALQLRL